MASKQVNIPVPPHGEEAGGTEKVNAAGCWTSRFKAVGRPGGKRNFRARPRADDVGFGPQVRGLPSSRLGWDYH
jgi:hypothetical protein